MDTKSVAADVGALPYRVSAEDLRVGVDRLRKLGKDALDAALKSKRVYVQNALQTLGLATEELDLTNLGRDLAYAREAGNESEIFLKVLLAYRPFKSAVIEFVAASSESSDTDQIFAFWGRKRVGVSEQNRRDGALVFLHICAAAGLGTLLVGRSGAKTRIAWVPDAADRIDRAGATVPRDPVESGAVIEPRMPITNSPNTFGNNPAPSGGPTESFRLVFPRGSGRIELPTDLRESDLSLVTAQLDAIMSLLKARIAIAKMENDVPS